MVSNPGSVWSSRGVSCDHLCYKLVTQRILFNVKIATNDIILHELTGPSDIGRETQNAGKSIWQPWKPASTVCFSYWGLWLASTCITHLSYTVRKCQLNYHDSNRLLTSSAIFTNEITANHPAWRTVLYRFTRNRIDGMFVILRFQITVISASSVATYSCKTMAGISQNIHQCHDHNNWRVGTYRRWLAGIDWICICVHR